MSTPFTESAGMPVSTAEPVIAFSPVTLLVPGRPVPLEVKVSAPATGDNLPVILFSHGHGQSNFLSSLRGYGPLVDFWAVRDELRRGVTAVGQTLDSTETHPWRRRPAHWCS